MKIKILVLALVTFLLGGLVVTAEVVKNNKLTISCIPEAPEDWNGCGPVPDAIEKRLKILIKDIVVKLVEDPERLEQFLMSPIDISRNSQYASVSREELVKILCNKDHWFTSVLPSIKEFEKGFYYVDYISDCGGWWVVTLREKQKEEEFAEIVGLEYEREEERIDERWEIEFHLGIKQGLGQINIETGD